MGGRNGGNTLRTLSEAGPGSSPYGVGPVLSAGEASHAVLEAMKSLNRDLTVLDRGSYWRVTAPGGCRLTREAVEKRLGRAFKLPSDLEAVMPSFTGRFRVDEEEARWESP
jgi:toluene monooxygenase system protein D